MEALKKYSEDLQEQFIYRYDEFVSICREVYDAKGMKLIRQSVEFLVEHTPEDKNMLGMHLSLFAIRMATMTVNELGLDALGISSVLISTSSSPISIVSPFISTINFSSFSNVLISS